MKFNLDPLQCNDFFMDVREGELILFSDGGVLSKVRINEVEFIVIKIISEHGSKSNPVSAREIESRLFELIPKKLTANMLKNAIASIRRKTRELVSTTLNNSDEFHFIVNANRVGYYVGLSAHSAASEVSNLNSIINNTQSRFQVLKFMLGYKPQVISMKVISYTLGGIALVGLIYFLQIAHLITLREKVDLKYDGTLLEIANEYNLGDRGKACLPIVNERFEDGAILVIKKDVEQCIIEKNKVVYLDSNSIIISDWMSKRDSYFYREVVSGEVRVIGRMKKKKITAPYKHSIIHPLLSGVTYSDNFGNNIGKIDNGIFIYKWRGDDSEISFYGRYIAVQVVFVVIFLIFVFERLMIIALFNYIFRLSNFSIFLNPIVNTKTGMTHYWEMFTRFKGIDTLIAINSLKKNGLLGLHTILVLKSIEGITPEYGRFGVNICPSLLRGRGFKKIYKAIKRCDKDVIIVEITECSEFYYDPHMLENISKIKNLGVHVILDNFGSGNNNIDLLDKISPDAIKIDRFFVSDLEHDLKQQKFVKDILSLMEGRTKIVVFEGVERESQSQILKGLGGYHQQGDFLSRP
ncbi:EAL domain-containing protein [Moritella sp. 36]|uniref:EAL domain-containing protein n=1 Tax=Moritella sp. 36 TaxID=2746233 RepID=UPI001BAA076B|nr:EAL domain-containing protein [Moritella sp. 36]QUM90490.1 EAL domain-containing protein [Moritella sp. 36]